MCLRVQSVLVRIDAKTVQDTAQNTVHNRSGSGSPPHIRHMTKESSEKTPILSRFNAALAKTRVNFAALFRSDKRIDAQILDELETSLLVCDVGVATTERIIDSIKQRVKRRRLSDREALLQVLREELLALTEPLAQPFEFKQGNPFVALFVGVNGVGKTTTIGKLAARLKSDGRSVLLAAGDTYRAAAIEQLQHWGEESDVPVVAQKQGGDSAAVIHDAIQAARKREIDVVLADTAGRLQTKTGLMDELAKVKRVITRMHPEAPHETILVLEAATGQNALSQLREFHASLTLSGLVLTKLDGSAKGGVILALAGITQLPLYFVGLGETNDALQPFDAESYVEGLLTP